MAATGGGATVAVDWDTAHVQISQPSEVLVRGTRVVKFFLFVNGNCLGSFSYATCKALSNSLAALGLTKELPKFPSKKALLADGRKQTGAVERLREWLEAAVRGQSPKAVGAVTSFVNGLAPVANSPTSVFQEGQVEEGHAPAPPARFARRSNSLHDISTPDTTGTKPRGRLRRFSSTLSSMKKGKRGAEGTESEDPVFSRPPRVEGGSAVGRSQSAEVGETRGGPSERNKSAMPPLQEVEIPSDELVLVKVDGDSLCANYTSVPSVWPWVARLYAASVTKVDLSHGEFRDLSALTGLVCLESLIADSNAIADSDLAHLPGIPGLKTLSLNQNRVQSLLAFVGFANVKYPRLAFVSLLGNPCCPSEVSGGTAEEYSEYRQQLVLSLTQLGWIDSASTALDRTDPHGQMSCHGLHAVTIPSWVNAARDTALGLDFSSGHLADISSLCAFTQLQTLVLDHNNLRSIAALPRLPTLRALSLNDNELDDLHATLVSIQKACDQVTFLSLLGNPCYPCELSSATHHAQRVYERHRAMVVMALPQLQFLDFRATDTEVPLTPEWLCFNTDSASASKILMGGGEGQYLVTELEGQYMLIVRWSGRISSFNIATDEAGLEYKLSGETFLSLESLVAQIHTVRLEAATGERIQLSTPVLRVAHSAANGQGNASSSPTYPDADRRLSDSIAAARHGDSVPWDSPSPPVEGVPVQLGQPLTASPASVSPQRRSVAMITASELPERFEWTVMDEQYPAQFDALQGALFGPSLDWWYEYYEEKKFKNVVCSGWKTKQRELNYTIPKSGLNPQVVIQERQKIVRDSAALFSVEVISQTPGVPYGTSFATHVQYVLQPTSNGATYFRVTAEVHWLKSCMLKSTINKKIESNLHKSFAHIKKYVDRTIGPESAA
eukprot:m.110006 g.110006  ORF g.110006 m.110006 type:complete len:898 (+) comp12864_c0_seq1:545-3238(+)